MFSRPVPFNTLSGVLSYMLSNVVDEAVSLTWNSARLFTAMAPIGPLTVRARLVSQADSSDRRYGTFDFRKCAVHPAVSRGFETGGSGLHVVLCVEVRARGVGRTDSVDDGQVFRVVDCFERPVAMDADRSVHRAG